MECRSWCSRRRLKNMKTLRFVLAFGLFASFVSAQALKADVVLINGKIRPMDNANSTFAAIAIKGNTVAAVGKTADILLLADSSTKIIDLKGKTVIRVQRCPRTFLGNRFAAFVSRSARRENAARICRSDKNISAKLPKGRWPLAESGIMRTGHQRSSDSCNGRARLRRTIRFC